MNQFVRATELSHYRTRLESFYAAEVRYVAAGGAKANADFSEMSAHFHPRAVIRQGPSVPYAGEWCGAEEIERFFAVHSDAWSSLDLSEIEYYAGDHGVAISLRMRATARSTGRQVDTRIGQFIIFGGDLIRDFSVFYFDPVQVKHATAS